MIITDPAIDYHGKFKQCSHMCSDLPGIEGSRELMAFARKIGMRPEWIQKPGTHHEHFDIFGDRRKRALAAGCVEVDRRRIVAVWRAKRAWMALHPCGACTCGNEGTCEWCRMDEERA